MGGRMNACAGSDKPPVEGQDGRTWGVYGTCPVCGRNDVEVRGDGMLRMHVAPKTKGRAKK